MTNILFYVIDTDDPAEQVSYAVQLALQTLALGRYLHIHTDSAESTAQILQQLASKLSSGDERLSIDHQGEPGGDRQVLLNLSSEVPHFFSSYESALEVICSDSKARESGREKYRYYQSRGYPLRHNKVSPQLAL